MQYAFTNKNDFFLSSLVLVLLTHHFCLVVHTKASSHPSYSFILSSFQLKLIDKMNSILTAKISKHGVKPYRSERAARCPTRLITSLPTFKKISKAGVMIFKCCFFDCKYMFTQHHKLIAHQTLTHGLIECDKCSVAYFTKAEKDNCFAKHESQGNAESTLTKDTVDQEGDLQHFIEGILDAEDENLVTVASPVGSSQLTSTTQPSCSLVQQQTLLPRLILKRFKCQKTECGRTFENEWALKSHFCAFNNYIIPKITGIDSTLNINKVSVKSRKAKSVESYSTDSSSDGDTDDVGKDLSWFPSIRVASSLKIIKLKKSRTVLNEDI